MMVFKKKQIAIFLICLFFLLNISPIHAETFQTCVPTNDSITNFNWFIKNSLELSDAVNISYNIFSANSKGKTALVLNPSENMYGNLHCRKIINKLLKRDYNIVYLSDEAVDLSFIKFNLSEEIVYMNTHAGYWDLDGDNISDTVVISTGELWTNETPEKYQFEFENQMIVEGKVGDRRFVTFTPALIEYYYNPGDFPNSLIFMATCFATYDNSMAEVFLDKGVSAYIGWNQNTVFWTNSLTSIRAFRLFSYGFSVKQVCNIIRSGGLINFFLQSKLTYYGDGNHRIL
jgi:hypothetical protein